jgi:arginine utilization protein RocB
VLALKKNREGQYAMTEFSSFDVKKEIHAIFSEYIRIKSYTNTAHEKEIEPFLESWFSAQPYFKTHPEFWGWFPVLDDYLSRNIVWGLVKGDGNDTVVLIHHYDVVDIEDYERAAPYAHDVYSINRQLQSMIHKFDQEAMDDLKSDNWQFGRGSADMKAGGAIQLAILKKQTLRSDFSGNLMAICLPDEENLSAGMRSAIKLLAQLKQAHNLNYCLMINAEPHQRLVPDTGVVYEGSIGKMMPVVYVRGNLVHVGKIFEGFNPLHLLSEIVVNTEMCMDFSDQISNEVAPPPTWMYFKDQKKHYDVSIPTVACGYLSVLTLNSNPEEFFEKFKSVIQHSFEKVLERMNASYEKYLRIIGGSMAKLPWKTNIKTFSELFEETLKSEGSAFQDSYDRLFSDIQHEIRQGKKSLAESTFDLIGHCLEYSKDKSPIVIIGLSPPYYPSVSNDTIWNIHEKIRTLGDSICRFAFERWNQRYVSKKIFTGISDLSYASAAINDEGAKNISSNLPLWGEVYRIPFEDIQGISMPCLNIGPWGKDFHKITERVFMEDLYERTPELLQFAIETALKLDSESHR